MILRPKPINCYVSINSTHNINDIIFDYSHFENIVYRPKVRLSDQVRTYIIKNNESEYNMELSAGLVIGKSVNNKKKE